MKRHEKVLFMPPKKQPLFGSCSRLGLPLVSKRGVFETNARTRVEQHPNKVGYRSVLTTILKWPEILPKDNFMNVAANGWKLGFGA